jgi:Thermolysin metallopeptidase, alpha-helical domain/Thermolysin metallopeptidase, catalytic domain
MTDSGGCRLDIGTLVVALVGALGGAAAAGVGSVLRTRSTGRTAARLVYAELTRNAAAVAYYCATRSWPSAALIHQTWDAHGEALARMRGAEVFDAIYRGYAALEAVAYIAADASLGPRERDLLLDASVAQLREALRVAGGQAQIPRGQVQAELERLAVAAGPARAAAALSQAPPSLLTQLVDIQRATGNTPPAELEAAAAPATGGAVLRVYDARNTEESAVERLALVRHDGGPPSVDQTVNEVYESMATTHAFYREVFGRESLDGAGGPLQAVVHYGRKFNNTFWNGQLLMVGDGDGELFQRFSADVDMTAHEFSHTLTRQAGLTYQGQPGALTESVCDVLGILVKQWSLRQDQAADADWVLGASLFSPAVKATGLRSLAAPGTAYDDPRLGKDPQPDHMRGYVETETDEGGVHINCGIPSHAFYLLATALGGPAWERAGRIWYDALTSQALSPTASFAAFAGLTVALAGRDHGRDGEEATATRAAWRAVGVTPRLSKRAAGLVGSGVGG